MRCAAMYVLLYIFYVLNTRTENGAYSALVFYIYFFEMSVDIILKRHPIFYYTPGSNNECKFV